MAWTRRNKSIVGGAVLLLLLSVATTLFLQRQNISDWMTLRAGERAVAKHIATPIDLTVHYTSPAFALENSSGYWGEIPWEFQVFHRVPLQLDGMLCLWGAGNARSGAVYPEQNLGIAVDQQFETLYVYHCTFYNSPKGTPVYDLVFRYEDGDSATNTMHYGIDTLDFNTPGGKNIKGPTGRNTKVAWIGSSFTPDGKHPLLFSLTAVANPRPSAKVTSIDLFSSKNQSAGIIFGMTAGPSTLMK
jgi:hypothetical protein